MQEYIFDFDDLLKYVRRKLCIFFAVITILIVAVIVFVNEIKVTYVVCDEKSQMVLSFTENTDLIIGRSGLKVKEDNKVVLTYFSEDQQENIIVITKPHDVLIYDRGKLA